MYEYKNSSIEPIKITFESELTKDDIKDLHISESLIKFDDETNVITIESIPMVIIPVIKQLDKKISKLDIQLKADKLGIKNNELLFVYSIPENELRSRIKLSKNRYLIKEYVPAKLDFIFSNASMLDIIKKEDNSLNFFYDEDNNSFHLRYLYDTAANYKSKQLGEDVEILLDTILNIKIDMLDNEVVDCIRKSEENFSIIRNSYLTCDGFITYIISQGITIDILKDTEETTGTVLNATIFNNPALVNTLYELFYFNKITDIKINYDSDNSKIEVYEIKGDLSRLNNIILVDIKEDTIDKKCILDNVSIYDADIKDLYFNNSAIYNSKLEGCVLVDSAISYTCSLNKCKLKNCNIQTDDIKDCEIK